MTPIFILIDQFLYRFIKWEMCHRWNPPCDNNWLQHSDLRPQMSLSCFIQNAYSFWNNSILDSKCAVKSSKSKWNWLRKPSHIKNIAIGTTNLIMIIFMRLIRYHTSYSSCSTKCTPVPPFKTNICIHVVQVEYESKKTMINNVHIQYHWDNAKALCTEGKVHTNVTNYVTSSIKAGFH